MKAWSAKRAIKGGRGRFFAHLRVRCSVLLYALKLLLLEAVSAHFLKSFLRSKISWIINLLLDSSMRSIAVGIIVLVVCVLTRPAHACSSKYSTTFVLTWPKNDIPKRGTRATVMH